MIIACPEQREEAPLLSGLDGDTGHNDATPEGSVGSMQPALATTLLTGGRRWDERAKLINLNTRLRGQAYSFYRSCTAQQRGDYGTLVAEFTKRFTPV